MKTKIVTFLRSNLEAWQLVPDDVLGHIERALGNNPSDYAKDVLEVVSNE